MRRPVDDPAHLSVLRLHIYSISCSAQAPLMASRSATAASDPLGELAELVQLRLATGMYSHALSSKCSESSAPSVQFAARLSQRARRQQCQYSSRPLSVEHCAAPLMPRKINISSGHVSVTSRTAEPPESESASHGPSCPADRLPVLRRQKRCQ